jgi:uncharacterized protein with FMN-binding domain
MPKRAMIAATLTAVALVLLLNFRTPDAALMSYPGTSSAPIAIFAPSGNPPATSSAPPGSIAAGAAASATAGGNKSFSGTLTGSVVQIPFGNVQVQVTISGGKITNVSPLQLPSGGRSGQIAAYAAPALRSEVLIAQSARVDTISGATYTSQGYLASLQSALSQMA